MIARREPVLIGIDCAAQTKNTGIAAGRVVDGAVLIEHLEVGDPDPAGAIAGLLEPPALVAFDSPLGWPAGLGSTLAGHRAGDLIDTEPNDLFRRATDRFVKQAIGKQSLDIGADRIARTAHAALDLLARLREKTKLRIDVAISQHDRSEVCCFEVYPAATLKARGIDARGYKGKRPVHLDARRRLIADLESELRIDDALTELAASSDDALDAAICCLAAADFLRGRCFEPDDPALAAKEGWIWLRRPERT